MLNTNKVYLVTIKSDIQLQNVAYGAVKDEDTNTVGWYDGERFRITAYKNINSESENLLQVTDRNDNDITWELFTAELFNKYKNDVFMADSVLKKSFDNDDDLQKYLNGLKDIE